VLAARRRAQLDEVATACAAHGVGAEVIVADLGTPGAAAALWAAATRTPVDILINNAGFGYFRPFGAIEWERDAELVQLNIASLVELSRLFVDHHSASLRDAARPGKAGAFEHHSASLRDAARPAKAGAVDHHSASLRDAARPAKAGAFDHHSASLRDAARPGKAGAVEHRRTRDGRAYLVNISSIGAYQAVPNMTLYAASKAFVRNFTEGLHDELRGSPLSVTCICPGGTHTDFHAMAGAGNYGWLANLSMLSAEEVAKISVRAMVHGKRIVVTGVLNKLACWGVRLVPRRVAAWMSRRVMGKPRPGALPARTMGDVA